VGTTSPPLVTGVETPEPSGATSGILIEPLLVMAEDVKDTAPGSGATAAKTVAEVANEDFMMGVKACVQPMIGVEFYPMKYNPRGYCLIFNNYDFPNHSYEYPHRHGSVDEAKRLKDIFEQLYFKVQVMDNSVMADTLKTIEEYSQKEELKRHDCFVLIVLSHGKSGGFITSDGQYIPFKEVVEQLNNKNCQNLINKPKLLFFSCCRGINKDYGVDHTVEALGAALDLDHCKSDAGKILIPEEKPKIMERFPIVSDIMICYSTIDQYVSWRCESKGSWLGMAIVKVLAKSSHELELPQLLTEITNHVNQRKGTEYGAKQVVEVIMRGFKKRFHFNPGYCVGSSTSTN